MGVKIVTDSASDIDVKRDDVEVIPITVTFDGVEYKDGIDLDGRGFYEKLVASDGLPRTSQVNPQRFEEAFRKLVEGGDDVVAVTLSSELSGTYNNAMIAADSFEGRVFVVDSENAAIGEAIIVERALELAGQGMGAKEIAQMLEEEKKDVILVALLDTLEYLKRGGRISPAAATVGAMLSIKPVIAVENGSVEVLGKARGSRKGNNLLVEQIRKTKGIDFDRPYMLGYSGFDESLLDRYIEDSKPLWEGNAEELPKSMIGCTIGTHIGPNAIGVAFFQLR